MYVRHPLLAEPENPDTKIWRYMDFTKFVALLERSALYFPRSDTLRQLDPFESSYPRLNVETLPTYAFAPEFSKERQEQMLAQLKDTRPNMRRIVYEQISKTIYVNCWHINDFESAAMWKLYLKSNEGIAIQTTVDRLRSCFPAEESRQISLGMVRYIDYDTEYIPEGNVLLLSMHKLRSYEHERELRAVTMHASDSDTAPAGLYLAVDLTALIQHVIVAPTAPTWFKELVQSVGMKYGLAETVFLPSALASTPLY